MGYRLAMSANRWDAYVGALDELVAYVESLSGPYEARVGLTRLEARLLWGLKANTHALASAAAPLWDDQMLSAATLPLTRCMFEAGVLAQWVAHDPEAADSLFGEHGRNRRALGSQLTKVDAFSSYSQAIYDSQPQIDGSRSLEAKHTWRMMGLFSNGHELYSYYRMLSAHTHAGVEVADQWVDQGTDDQTLFRAEPKGLPTAVPMLALYGLVLASSAFYENFSTLDGSNPTLFLSSLAERLAVPYTLTFTGSRT